MAGKSDYRNTSLSFYLRAEDLISRMTLPEKVSQMLHRSPAIPRLGIPEYNWWNECLHGVGRAGTATVFPQPIGLAAAFDEVLMERIGDVIAIEARIKNRIAEGYGDVDIGKGLTFWAPNVNLFRDPRWGRGHETYGEDPYLASRLGVRFIHGLQGKGQYLKTAAGAKHFAVHSGPEAERHSFDAQVSKKDLYETYLPAFEACVKEGGVETVMGAYNRVNGEACCASKTLLVGILRKEWKFKGHVVSDCWAIEDIHKHHKLTQNACESAALAVSAGCDLNCGGLYSHILEAVEKGLLTEQIVDTSVKRLMLTRLKLGLFSEDEVNRQFDYDPDRLACADHRALAVNAARASMVLLKNADNILPLDRDRICSLAVIGPNADSREALLGNYNGTPPRHVTVLEGIEQMAGDTIRIHYSEGCHLYKKSVEPLAGEDDRLAEAVHAAKISDAVILVLGMNTTLEGEQGDVGNSYGSGDKPDLDLPGRQQELLDAVCSIGKPVIVVLLSGSALAISRAEENAEAIIQAWYPGGEGGTAVGELLFGHYSPSGRLPVTFYRTTQELPAFNNYSMAGRTYKFMKNQALFPFGYGLSYSTFTYSQIGVSSRSLGASRGMTLTVTIRNTGDFNASETVQLYIKNVAADPSEAVYKLSRIRKIFLCKKESLRIELVLSVEDFSFINEEGLSIINKGRYIVYVGRQQPDSRSFELTGERVREIDVSID